MLLVPTVAGTWTIPINHPHCPAYDPATTWRDYLSTTAPIPPNVGNSVGIEFTKAKAVNDPDAIGNLRTDVCYGAVYVRYPKGSYPLTGYSSHRNIDGAKGPDQKHGLPGDPKQYEINVYGTLLMFNDAGEVINRKGKPVGVLVCYLRSQDKCAGN